MSKPASIPTWATNTNYAASSQPWASTPTKVQPPSGYQTNGVEPEDPVVAQYENHHKNLVGQWITWIDSFFDASENLVMPVNKNITLSGTGIVKTDPRWRDFPVFGGDFVNGVYAGTGTPISRYTTAGGTNFYSFPIHGLKVGTKIWQTRARIQDSATGPTTLKCRGRTSADSSGSTFGTAGAASAGNGTTQTIQSDHSGGSPFITMTSSPMSILVEVFFAGGSAACSIFSVGLLVSED